MSYKTSAISIAALLTVAGPVLAQSAQPASETGAVAQAAPGSSLEEIVVTAQKRSSTIQKSSLDIQAVSSTDLLRTGTTGPQGLTAFIPGLQITAFGGYPETFIRGVGSFNTNAYANNAVAYNIDGVVADRSYSVGTEFYDLARVEVLKGPQGTLYGRNATGGAVNLITNNPTQEFGGYITGELGNYDLRRGTGAVNIPLADDFTTRLAFQVIDRSGYLSDGRDDDSSEAGRLTTMWTPTDAISLRTVVEYSHLGGQGAGAVFVGNGYNPPGGNLWTGLATPYGQAYLQQQSGGIATPLPAADHQDVRAWNLSAELNWDLDFATLTVIPAYRYSILDRISYAPGAIVDNENTASAQKTLEVRLSHNNDFIKWVAGFYEFNIESRDQVQAEDSPFIPGFNPFLQTPKLDTNSYAGFGETTVSVLPDLRLIAGLRYTHEDTSIAGTAGDVFYPSVPKLSEDNQSNFSRITFKAGIEYDIAPQSMGYFTVSTGFKAGGFFPAPAPYNSYKPETLTAYTVGIRNRFLDNRLQVNLEGFYWDYKNQATQTIGYTPSGFLTLETLNVGASTLDGLDLDVVARITPQDTIRFAGEYLHTTINALTTQYPAAFSSGLYTGCQVGTTLNGQPPFQTYSVDCAGKQQPHSPKWSGSVGLEHVQPLGQYGQLTANLDLTFATSRFISYDFTTLQALAPGYVTTDFSLTYEPEQANWSVTGYVKNMTNEAVYQVGLQGVLNSHIYTSTIGAPRTFGFQGTYKF